MFSTRRVFARINPAAAPRRVQRDLLLSGIFDAALSLAVCGSALAQTVTFTSSHAAWSATTLNNALVATFSESLWPVNAVLPGDWTLNDVTYSGHAGVPVPNIYVFANSPLEGNALTANGDEDIDLAFQPPRTAFAFDVSVNPFGPVTVTIFDSAGALIGTSIIEASTNGFFGCISSVPVGRANFRSVNGAQVNSLLDNVRLADVCPANFNCDTAIDFFDYLDFVDAFSSQVSAADFNRDGTIDFFDYLDFVDAFSIGC